MSLILGGAALIGGAIGGASKRKEKENAEAAGKEAAALARREAELNWQATQEEVRRLEVTHDQIMSQATANVGAMGFASDSASQAGRLGEVQGEFEKERQFMLDTGQEASSIASQNANLTEKYAGKGISVAAGALQGASTAATATSWWMS